MKMHLHRKVLLSLAIISVSNTFLVSFQSNTCATEEKTIPNAVETIAYGRNGAAGRDGPDGPDRVISTEDFPMIRLDLSGGDGSDGGDGTAGASASCSQDAGYNLLATNGGSGGAGGEGGDGGSLTVFYQSLEDLKQIYVISRGGRGGKGGRAGEGGSGCRHCEPDFEVPEIEIPDLPEIEMPDLNQGKGGYYSPSKRFRPNVGNIPWAVRPRTALPSTLFEKTFLVKDERCITKPGGAPGSSGRDGEAGEMGHLYLVEQGIEFRPDQPTQRVELSSFEQNQVISLSKNLWETHQGALALLAPGSVMADEYYEYSGRLEQAYRIVWNALQPATDFLDERITLTLTETGELEIFSPEDIWLASQISEQDGTAQFAIEHVVQREEATQLAWVDFSGNQSNLSISLIDRARKSDILTTQFRLKYRVAHDQRTDRPRPSAYSTQYDGPVPAALVTQNHQQFTLNLGQLPIDSPYLRPGLNIEIELTAIRSLSGRSAEQRIVWRGKVEP